MEDVVIEWYMGHLKEKLGQSMKRHIKEVALMNELQDRGLISDNCITEQDCSEKDLFNALNNQRSGIIEETVRKG